MLQYIDFSEMKVGDSLPSLTKDPVTRVQLVRYAGASGDFNPLHTDDDVARKAGLQGVIAHGMLIMGFVGQAITEWFSIQNLKRFKVRFSAMTYPGDKITVSATLAEKKIDANGVRIICDTAARDQRGEVKLVGQFEAFIPIP